MSGASACGPGDTVGELASHHRATEAGEERSDGGRAPGATKAPSRPASTPAVRGGGLCAFVAVTSVARCVGPRAGPVRFQPPLTPLIPRFRGQLAEARAHGRACGVELDGGAVFIQCL